MGFHLTGILLKILKAMERSLIVGDDLDAAVKICSSTKAYGQKINLSLVHLFKRHEQCVYCVSVPFWKSSILLETSS